MPLIRKGGETIPPDDAKMHAGDKLRTGTSDERWAAARALSSGQPHALTALGRALFTEQDARVREAILTGLARIDTAESAEAIVSLVRSDDAGLRTGALDALRVMPEALKGHLAGLLNDADPDVRVLACDLARQLPGEAATRLLSSLLERELQANVCAAAIDVLAECGDAGALPAIDKCAKRFADVAFIVFSAKVARDRIRAQALDHGG